MKRKGSVFLACLIIVAVGLCFTGSLLWAASPEAGSCVKCHTDAAALKSLFKPPKISAEEGEG
jgi:hypothetical protein